MALTPEQQARLAELEAKFGGSTPATKTERPSSDAPSNPILRGIEGAGRKVRQTTVQPLFRLLGSMGVPGMREAVESMQETDKERDLGAAGSIGGGIADVAMIATPQGMGKTLLSKAATAGAAGAGMHQAQNYGQTGEVSPGEAFVETGIATAIPYLGSKVAPLFKGAGKGVIRSVVQPTGKMKNPNLEPALSSSKGLKKYLEGIEGLNKRMGENVGKAGTAKAQALEDAGFTGSRFKAMKAAVEDIDLRRPEMGPKLGMNAPEREAAIEGVNRWAEPKSKLTPKETISLLSKMYDDAYKSGRDVNLAGREQGARILAKKLRDQMDLAVENADPAVASAYKKASEDFRTFEPIRQATKHRVETPSSRRLPLGRIPLVGDLIEPVVYRPGTANALYDIGRAAESKAGRYSGKGLLDLARFGRFSPSTDE